MFAKSQCPPEILLRDYLLGLLSEEEITRQTAHLDGCPSCLERVQRLTASDWLVDSLNSSGDQKGLRASGDEELTERLRRRSNTPAGAADDTVVAIVHEAPCIPGYDILEEIGRGGMGVVFRARQHWPRRVVALKTVRIDNKPSRRARFRAEVAAAARFIHPNVISIYEVGESRGLPFFSMEYAAGGSLAHKLAQGPLPMREAAELVQMLARAIEFGHACGVVHRDLKPANVLLQCADGQATNSQQETDRSRTNFARAIPKIADFGLARCLDEISQTQTGDLLGTPAYMAPELTRATGTADPPAADIYSLGAVLYETLTGRPPFGGATPVDTLEQVRSRDPVAPRRLRPGVPRDLETICLKCLSKQPARRYATAAALADDLQCFLEGRPIRARRVGTAERALKWIRRHPASATLAAGLFALIGAGILYELRLHEAWLLAESNAVQASKEKDRADANYREARKALATILQRAKGQSASGLPKLRELQRLQSEDAVAFYRNLVQQSGDSVDVRFDRAWAQHDASLLENDLGRREEAIKNVDSARETFALLAAQYPGDARYRCGLASTLLALGGVDLKQFAPSIQEAHRLYEALLAEEPGREDYISGYANACNQLAILRMDQHRPDDAIQSYEQAVTLRKSLLTKHPGDRAIRLALAQNDINLCHLCFQRGQQARGKQLHEEAETDLGNLQKETPHDLDICLAHAALRVNWAYVLREEGKLPEAIAELSKNVTELLDLLKQEPESTFLRDNLYRSFGLRAQLYAESKAYGAVLADQKRSLEFAPTEQLRLERKFYLALAYADAGEHRQAVTLAEALANSLPSNAPTDFWIHLTTVCVTAARKAREDKSLNEKDRKASIERSVSVGFDCLRKARAGISAERWKTILLELSSTPEFSPLTKDPRWKELSAL
jgi:eukaryotic-like serine/threonine-protein kinase